MSGVTDQEEGALATGAVEPPERHLVALVRSEPISIREVRTARANRTLRIFVSSTFQDMHAERDQLVKRVFPRLRKLCQSRGVELVEVDLRWGISEEESARGEVLAICLAEISRCRPYFVGILGERYGWVPATISEQLRQELPWLCEDSERSATEIEILHGALNQPERARRAHFYFRDPAYSGGIPTEEQGNHLCESPQALARLKNLKQRIATAGVSLRQNYPDPSTLGGWILEDLTSAIELDFPPKVVTNALEREAEDQAAFAQSRVSVYVGREQYYRALDQLLASGRSLCVVLGPSGSGKSALIANYAADYRLRHPDAFVLEHYVGGSADSGDYAQLIRRCQLEIQRRYQILDQVPTSTARLRETFPEWLAHASSRGGLLLFLDGINQLDDRDHALDLEWLPRDLPQNVQVVTSTLPGPTLLALEQREHVEVTVEPLVPEERQRLITEYLDRYRKRLGAPDVDAIASAETASDPHFLRILLNELRVSGDHQVLRRQLQQLLDAKTVPALFQVVLGRLETDFIDECPDLVCDAMSLILASRRGLSEHELMELVGSPHRSLTRTALSAFLLSSEEHLLNRSGLLTFSHDFLRAAVKLRYLPERASELAAHRRLADYFQRLESGSRRTEELPWQLRLAEDWDGLRACLCTWQLFESLQNEQERYELLAHWQPLQEHLDMVTSYTDALSAFGAAGVSPIEMAARMHSVAVFLEISSCITAAEVLYRRAWSSREATLGPAHPDTQETLYELARLLRNRGAFVEAEPLYRRLLNGAPPNRVTAWITHEFAVLLRERGDLQGAETEFRRALAHYEQASDATPSDIATTEHELATLFQQKADYPAAEALLTRVLAIYRRIWGAQHPRTAIVLTSIANVRVARGDYDSAEELYKQALRATKSAFGPRHPRTASALGFLGYLFLARGEPDQAQVWYEQALSLRQAALGEDHLDTAVNLHELARVADMQKHFEEAKGLCLRALQITERIDPRHPNLGRSRQLLGRIYFGLGAWIDAERAYRGALQIERDVFGETHPDTVTSSCLLAQALDAQHRFQPALELLQRSLSIAETMWGPTHVTTVEMRGALQSVQQHDSLRDAGIRP